MVFNYCADCGAAIHMHSDIAEDWCTLKCECPECGAGIGYQCTRPNGELLGGARKLHRDTHKRRP